MEHKIDEKKQGGYYLKQFVVVGGDLRCHYLVLYLKEQGYPVFTWKVPELADTGEKLQDIIGNLKTDDTLKETGLLLPVPVTKDGIHPYQWLLRAYGRSTCFHGGGFWSGMWGRDLTGTDKSLCRIRYTMS